MKLCTSYVILSPSNSVRRTRFKGGVPMGEPVIAVEGLRKRYGDTKALDGVDLSVPAGAVHGLLGPNGAGKTTMVRVLTTLTRPDAGRARIAGHDVVREA